MHIDGKPFDLQKSDITEMDSSFYNIQINDLKGNHLDLHQFAGKKLMIVNVASECGFTQQYAQLEELYETFKDKINILACPCNDFGGQEPGNPEQIESFCRINYGVTFTISEKINILKNTHDLYKWLRSQSEHLQNSPSLVWNFHKYLIDEKGYLHKSVSSSTDPLSEDITEWVVGIHN